MNEEEKTYVSAPEKFKARQNLESMFKQGMQRILVIEDNPQHLEDAKSYFADKEDVLVNYATNYIEAAKTLYRKPFSSMTEYGIPEPEKTGYFTGVISDIYFPHSDEEEYSNPEPIGVRMALELESIGIPFVLNTAGFHHGSKYEWINGLANQKSWNVVETGNDHTTEANHKDWKLAYRILEREMVK